jgi:CBS domain-containing protein
MEGVTARDVMSRTFAGVSEGDDVDDVLELMVDEVLDDVLVLRGDDPVGHVDTHDLLRVVADDGGLSADTVESIMRPPPDSIDADSDLSDVLSRLSTVDSDRLPVANGDEGVVGVVTEADVIAAASTVVTEPHATDAGGPERIGAAEAGAVAGTGQTAVADREADDAGTAQDQYSSQSVCESCGTLSADLQLVNGQSICPECRDV